MAELGSAIGCCLSPNRMKYNPSFANSLLLRQFAMSCTRAKVSAATLRSETLAWPSYCSSGSPRETTGTAS